MYEFYDLQHAKSRLEHSVILLNGKPIYVTSVSNGRPPGDKYSIKYKSANPRTKEATKIITYPHKGLDYKPMRLGLMNTNRMDAVVVERDSLRQWKLGLTLNNTTFHRVYNTGNMSNTRMTNDVFVDVEFQKMLLGIYPDYEKAINRLLKNNISTAFHKNFAIVKRGVTDPDDNIKANIFNKVLGRVGSIKANNEPVLLEQFFFLKEELDGAIG